MKETSRRAILAGIAATPAVAVPALATEPEPVFAVLAEYVRCRDAYFSASARLDEAEGQTTERRPIPLIAWRNYSHIGCSEIDRVREEFLAAPDADAEQIEREYREAKATERAAQQAEEDWYVRNGLAELKAESGKARPNFRQGNPWISLSESSLFKGLRRPPRAFSLSPPRVPQRLPNPRPQAPRRPPSPRGRSRDWRRRG